MRLANQYNTHVPVTAGPELIDAVRRSGLRGRGGAGFPAGRKLAAVAAARGRAVVVANGCEGEPLSAKDGWLLEQLPQLVLDGAVACARAVGARRVLLCVGDRHAERVREAIGTRRDPVTLEGRIIPDAYVAGEETALAHALGGGPAGTPRFGARVYERGVRERPTLVQNVETLAHIALIARHGPDWFRERGTPADPGTALVTLSGAVGRPGVTEVELGTPLAAVLSAAQPIGAPRAVLIGGYFGAWVDAAAAIPLEHPLLGCGVLAALGEWQCGVCETGRVLRYLAGQSSGQCGPCRFGLRAIAGQFDDLTQPGALARLRRWADDIEGRGACGHPDGAVRLLRSALDVFAAEFAAHADGRHRSAA
jgi:NADH:ubiquinone oxidoreductase subunit F (NADH-binding)